MNDKLLGIIQLLQELEGDAGVPKNVKEKITATMKILNEETELSIKKSRAMHALEEVSDDANVQSYNRMQLFNIISALEIV